MHPARPTKQLAQLQAEWLRGGRIRLLRAASIHRRNHILELGTGWGQIAVELAERGAAQVTAVDLLEPDSDLRQLHPSIHWLTADAAALPLEDHSVDLIFTQCAWLWFAEPARVLQELQRVLHPTGAIACIEPDYAGMIEFPASQAVREIWCQTLARCGADPQIGRKLPCWLVEAGMHCDVYLSDRLAVSDDRRYDFLLELPLTGVEREAVQQARIAATGCPANIAHLPFCFIHARWSQ